MHKSLALCLLAGAVLGALSGPVSGQSALERRLAAAKRLECRFTALATGDWRNATPGVAVTQSDLRTTFSAIDVEEGTAEAESAYGASFVSVRYAAGYLHIMQMSDGGPLHVTTVLARAADGDRLMAVHTRHEYAPTIVTGFTARPEMYVGSCAIGS